ncbi:MAG: Rne/Rng family ribonuclease, partial [Acetobacteraceae bacterium]|nr:Rne/Rng family ribonuclease [Acetobacteraceae bacterium]
MQAEEARAAQAEEEEEDEAEAAAAASDPGQDSPAQASEAAAPAPSPEPAADDAEAPAAAGPTDPAEPPDSAEPAAAAEPQHDPVHDPAHDPLAAPLPPFAATADTRAPAGEAASPAAPDAPAADQPPASDEAAGPAGRAQPLAIAVEQISGPADAATGGTDPQAAVAMPPAEELGPASVAPQIIEVALEPAPPPEQINADAVPQAEDDQPSRRIPPKFLRNYKIQEVIKRRQILLVQVVKEERGTKGAALTTYLSLAGRYCVLMPNSPRGGGISRKITSAADRRRLREITTEMQIPEGMGLIVRTAGAQRPKAEIKRDCEYLLRLWDSIRETTLASSAPALIYEEASLIKRSIRDVYTRDIDEIVVEGEDAYRQAKDFMRMLMPSHARKVQPYRDSGAPLFVREKIENQLDAMHSPTVQLKSGGYVVINQTEALVAIDVNSGRSTRERGIEETALRTNLEAADEVARQLRLRDFAGLIVIDFIDMESARHNAAVERRLKEALKHDRARIQVGRISHFGLLEMSRQRLHPSLTEQAFITCPHCNGTGLVRTTESAAMQVLRAIEEEGAKRRAAEIVVACATALVLYLLNHKRARLAGIEAQAGMRVLFAADDALIPPAHRIERTKAAQPAEALAAAPAPAALPGPAAVTMAAPADADDEDEAVAEEPDIETGDIETGDEEGEAHAGGERDEDGGEDEGRRRRRRRRRGRRENGQGTAAAHPPAKAEADFSPAARPEDGPRHEEEAADESGEALASDGNEAEGAAGQGDAAGAADDDESDDQRRRRRGRRGGRRRRRDETGQGTTPDLMGDAAGDATGAAAPADDDAAGAPGPGPASEAPAPRARWTGPTPADPFATGGEYDVFAALEAAEEAAAREAEARASLRHPPEPVPQPEPPAEPSAIAPAPEPGPAAALAPPEPTPEPPV